MSTNKTLIGTNNILFLCNDSSDELNIHCNNILKVWDKNLSRYSFTNYMIFVYPDKSLIYKDNLPDNYIFKYRPALNIYKQVFNERCHDLYDILKNTEDVYYKTDTHINCKGNYMVYKYFMQTIANIFNEQPLTKQLDFNITPCILKTLPYGLGDLTWEYNLGDQVLDNENIIDNFYFNEHIHWFYCSYKITNTNNIKFLSNNLSDNTDMLIDKIVSWDIISNYIVYVKNDITTNTNIIPLKILIFYDSFLLHVLPLYFDIFAEIYFSKTVYTNELIEKINPDYVFEFRVERFLF